MLLDCVQDDDVAVQLVATLLVHEAAEVLSLAELRWTFSQVLKEALIRLVKTLKHFLHSLAVKESTANALGKMLLHRVQTDIAVEQSVVPFLKSKRVVPYETALAKHRINLAIAAALIECIFVCHHST